MRIVGLQRSATLLAFLFAVGCLLLVVGVGATPAAGGEFDGAGSVAASQADALVVDGDGSGEYETIQAAVDDAADGDTIRVLDGTYAGFAVDKDVTITTTAARLEAPVVIRGDGAPTIEGFTIRPTDSDSVFGVSAADTGGDWVLRDVTVAISADVGRAVFAKGSTGDWRIESSILEDDVSARETAGDWEITNTTITTYITATDASGDWTIRDSVIHGKSTDSAPLDALNTTGAWVVENTVVLGDSGTFSPESVQTAASDGAWTIQIGRAHV